MKTSKKTFKPAYVVDMTKATTAEDLFLEFVVAKVNAGIAISGEELKHTIEHFVNDAVSNAMAVGAIISTALILADQEPIKPKKLPWYKRFWRWITFRSNK